MSDQNPWGMPNNPKKDPLDELIKKLKKYFADMNQQKGASPEGSGDGEDNNGRKNIPKKAFSGFSNFKFLPILLLILVVVGLFKSTHQIQPGERGVILRLGKYYRTTTPGLNLIIPFIDTLTKVNVETIRREEFGFRTGLNGRNSGGTNNNDESLMLTGDRNVINLNWVVQYSINSPEKYLFSIRQIPLMVRDVSEHVIRRLVGNRDFDYLLNNREELAFTTKVEMQAYLDKFESGVTLQTVQLQDVTPPEPVRPSFNEVNEADQDKTRSVNEAQQVYNNRIPEARGKAKQLLEEAAGYKIRRVNQALGDTQRFTSVYEQYRRFAAVTKQRLYLEVLRDVMPNVKEILVVDGNRNMMPLLNFSGSSAGKILNTPNN